MLSESVSLFPDDIKCPGMSRSLPVCMFPCYVQTVPAYIGHSMSISSQSVSLVSKMILKTVRNKCQTLLVCYYGRLCLTEVRCGMYMVHLRYRCCAAFVVKSYV